MTRRLFAHGIGATPGPADPALDVLLRRLADADPLVVALGILWKEPRLQSASGQAARGGLARLILGPMANSARDDLGGTPRSRLARGPSSGGRCGGQHRTDLIWVASGSGSSRSSSSSGPLERAHPWRAVADGSAGSVEARRPCTRRRLPTRSDSAAGRPPPPLGVRDARARLPRSAEPRTLALAIVGLQLGHLGLMLVYGRRAWLENGEASRLLRAPLADLAFAFERRTAGTGIVQPPLSGLARGDAHPARSPSSRSCSSRSRSTA